MSSDHRTVPEALVQIPHARFAGPCGLSLPPPATRGKLVRQRSQDIGKLERPYLEAARSLHADIADVTPLVRREPGAGSTSKLAFAERQTQYEITGPLPVTRRLLVLDDLIATGESAAHVIEIVRHHTASMPEVVIAAPLWVPPKDQNASLLR